MILNFKHKTIYENYFRTFILIYISYLFKILMKKKITLFILITMSLCSLSLVSFGQSKANDIGVAQLPTEVKKVLDEYVDMLINSSSLEDCAAKFSSIAGGGLVNEDGLTLRNRVQPYSLKKDYENIKFYAQPLNITRVNATYSNGQGFGESAIKGMVYKIWIAKKNGQVGIPAPISIMVPDGHPTITTPKVVNIGSL